MSIRKSALVELGGFDENFGEYCYAEYLEISQRLVN